MTNFREVVEDGGLIDMGFLGPKFTWSNKQEGDSMILERLDRGTCNPGWKHLFPFASIRHLEFGGSDHRPIILDISDGPGGRGTGTTQRIRKFFFEECWVDDSECQEIVESSWDNTEVSDCIGQVLGNIASCGSNLSSWNATKRRDMRQEITKVRGALTEACRADSPSSWCVINGLENQLEVALGVEERYWKQRARIDWLKSGD